MNKEEIMKMYYLRIKITACDYCYERSREWKQTYDRELKESNLMMNGNHIIGICYEKMKWRLNEINQIRAIHKTEHKNGMWSVHTTIKVELKKH